MNRLQTNERDGVLTIGGDVGINAAEELHSLLRDLIQSNSNPVVDLSGVESVDAAVLQLLIAARKTAENVGKPFAFTGLPPAVVDVSAVLGLSLTDCVPFPAQASRGQADADV